MFAVCRIPGWPDSVQHSAHKAQAFLLPPGRDLYLGWHLAMLRSAQELFWHPRRSGNARIGREPILSRSAVSRWSLKTSHDSTDIVLA